VASLRPSSELTGRTEDARGHSTHELNGERRRWCSRRRSTTSQGTPHPFTRNKFDRFLKFAHALWRLSPVVVVMGHILDQGKSLEMGQNDGAGWGGGGGGGSFFFPLGGGVGGAEVADGTALVGSIYEQMPTRSSGATSRFKCVNGQVEVPVVAR